MSTSAWWAINPIAAAATCGLSGYLHAQPCLDPARQALLGVLAETPTLALLASPLLAHRPARVHAQLADAR